METRTTDLDKVKNGARFTWGRVLEIYNIDRYDIVKYKDSLELNEKYHVYVDGKSTSYSASSLEGALLLAIAKAHLPLNDDRYMAQAAAKILNVDT